MTDWEKRRDSAAANYSALNADSFQYARSYEEIEIIYKEGANWSRQQDLELRKEMLSVLALVEECLTGLRPVVTVLPRLVALREKVRACGHD